MQIISIAILYQDKEFFLNDDIGKMSLEIVTIVFLNGIILMSLFLIRINPKIWEDQTQSSKIDKRA